MKKIIKIYNTLETIEEKSRVIFLYVFIYGFAICFILIGITLMLTPGTPPEYPKWFYLMVGSSFLMVGCIFMFNAIKFTLEEYIETKNEKINK